MLWGLVVKPGYGPHWVIHLEFGNFLNKAIFDKNPYVFLVELVRSSCGASTLEVCT